MSRLATCQYVVGIRKSAPRGRQNVVVVPCTQVHGVTEHLTELSCRYSFSHVLLSSFSSSKPNSQAKMRPIQAIQDTFAKRTSDEAQHQLLLPDGCGNAFLQAPLVKHCFCFPFVFVVINMLSMFFSS